MFSPNTTTKSLISSKSKSNVGGKLSGGERLNSVTSPEKSQRTNGILQPKPNSHNGQLDAQQQMNGFSPYSYANQQQQPYQPYSTIASPPPLQSILIQSSSPPLSYQEPPQHVASHNVYNHAPFHSQSNSLLSAPPAMPVQVQYMTLGLPGAVSPADSAVSSAMNSSNENSQVNTPAQSPAIQQAGVYSVFMNKQFAPAQATTANGTLSNSSSPNLTTTTLRQRGMLPPSGLQVNFQTRSRSDQKSPKIVAGTVSLNSPNASSQTMQQQQPGTISRLTTLSSAVATPVTRTPISSTRASVSKGQQSTMTNGSTHAASEMEEMMRAEWSGNSRTHSSTHHSHSQSQSYPTTHQQPSYPTLSQPLHATSDGQVGIRNRVPSVATEDEPPLLPQEEYSNNSSREFSTSRLSLYRGPQPSDSQLQQESSLTSRSLTEDENPLESDLFDDPPSSSIGVRIDDDEDDIEDVESVRSYSPTPHQQQQPQPLALNGHPADYFESPNASLRKIPTATTASGLPPLSSLAINTAAPTLGSISTPTPTAAPRKFHMPTQHHPTPSPTLGVNSTLATTVSPITPSVASLPSPSNNPRSSTTTLTSKPATSLLPSPSDSMPQRQQVNTWMISPNGSIGPIPSTGTVTSVGMNHAITPKRVHPAPLVSTNNPDLQSDSNSRPLSATSKSMNGSTVSPPSSVSSSSNVSSTHSPIILTIVSGATPKLGSLNLSADVTDSFNMTPTSSSSSTSNLLPSLTTPKRQSGSGHSNTSSFTRPPALNLKLDTELDYGEQQASNSSMLDLQRSLSEKSAYIMSNGPFGSPGPNVQIQIMASPLAPTTPDWSRTPSGSRTKSQPDAMLKKTSASAINQTMGGAGGGLKEPRNGTPPSVNVNTVPLASLPPTTLHRPKSGSRDHHSSASGQYHSFPLRIVFDSSFFGLRSERHFPLPSPGGLIIDRYKMVRVLGRAVFSTAIQVVDLQPSSSSHHSNSTSTCGGLSRSNSFEGRRNLGQPSATTTAAIVPTNLCMKILKNQKEFIDQALDEIRILTQLNQAQDALFLTNTTVTAPSPHSSKRSSLTPSPIPFLVNNSQCEKFILRLHDSFYFHETIFLVTELLGANLYEVMKKSKACAQWHVGHPGQQSQSNSSANKKTQVDDQSGWLLDHVHSPDQIDTSYCLSSSSSSISSTHSTPEKERRGNKQQLSSPPQAKQAVSKSPRGNATQLSPILSTSSGGGGFHSYLFNLASIRSIAFQLATSLEFLHSQGFIHGDLKPENILLDPQPSKLPSTTFNGRTLSPRIKLIDFGSSIYCPSTNSAKTNGPSLNYVQSRPYRAPEIILGMQPYSHAIDLWSLGAILVELFTGETLFPLQHKDPAAASSHHLDERDPRGSISCFHNLLTSLHKMQFLFGQGYGQGFSFEFLKRILNQPARPIPRSSDGSDRATKHSATAAVLDMMNGGLNSFHERITHASAEEEDDSSLNNGVGDEDEENGAGISSLDNGSRVLHFFELRAATPSTQTHSLSGQPSSSPVPSPQPSPSLTPQTPIRTAKQTLTNTATGLVGSAADVCINILASPLGKVAGKLGLSFPSSSPNSSPRVLTPDATAAASTNGFNFTGPQWTYGLKSLGVANAYGAMPSPAVMSSNNANSNSAGSGPYANQDWSISQVQQSSIAQEDIYTFDEKVTQSIPSEQSRLHDLLTATSVAQLHQPHLHPAPSIINHSSRRKNSGASTTGHHGDSHSPPHRKHSRTGSASTHGSVPLPSSAESSFQYGTGSTASEWTDFLDFLMRLLTIDPAYRMTAAEALTHPFITQQQ